jgi:glycosyltransferase involved in cell wall biosynthesis
VRDEDVFVKEPVISLIVATLHRVDELDRLLRSLEEQSWRAFEVIVVDQNPDDRLLRIFGEHHRLPIRHLRCPRGLSRARNVGLCRANGSLIAIPDDDCWYPRNLLESVAAWFDAHPRFSLLGTALRTADNQPSGPRSPKKSCACTRRNVWNCAVSTALFMRREVAEAVGKFDEEIGVGADSVYQSGEETDYVLRALEHGFEMWYEAPLVVHHPRLDSLARLRKTSYPFALGTGRVLRRHNYSLFQVGALLLRSFGGAAVSACRGQLDRAFIYTLRGTGQLAGYLSSRRQTAQLR